MLTDMVRALGLSMVTLNVAKAKARLSFLIESVLRGEEAVIARRRKLGMDRAPFALPDHFDAPFSEDRFAALEGRE